MYLWVVVSGGTSNDNFEVTGIIIHGIVKRRQYL